MQIPRWQREIITFKGVKSLIILEGNVNDIYPILTRGERGYRFNSFGRLTDVLFGLFRTGTPAYEFITFDPVFGFVSPADSSVPAGLDAFLHGLEAQEQAVSDAEATVVGRTSRQHRPSLGWDSRHAEVIRSLMTDSWRTEAGQPVFEAPVAVAADFSSRHFGESERDALEQMIYGALRAQRRQEGRNTLILIVDRLGDLPTWAYMGNPAVRTISIPRPEAALRKFYMEAAFPESYRPGSGDHEEEKAKDKFLDLTGDMQLVELEAMGRLLAKEAMGARAMPEAVNLYKYGYRENPWETMWQKIPGLRGELEKRVKGQPQALDAVETVLKRSVTGLSGMQHSSDSKPKGILFLVGPTGTGKTELVKATTAQLFGDEKSYIRFDMSEYSKSHADQRLFGAPPGYVGYEAGGQLTNAVKQNPFAILLFDEIEKADDSIMDKFLQILEDGRMTDGQGQVVSFSQTFIFFTSNIGISERRDGQTVMLVKPGDDDSRNMELIREHVDRAMENRFRPELLNRIGRSNRVYFNFLSPQTVRDIVDSQLKSIGAFVEKKYPGASLNVGPQAREALYVMALEGKVKHDGGRGIGNMLEEQYINPLAEFLFAHHEALATGAAYSIEVACDPMAEGGGAAFRLV